MRRAGPIVLVFALLGAPAIAQVTCPDGTTMDGRQLRELLAQRVGEATNRKTRNATDEAADSPRLSPDADQTSATGSAPISPDVLSGPDFTSLVALAMDNGLLSESDGALTLDLNFFSFLTALDSSVLQKQEEYQRYSTLRRFGGAVTSGGTGDSFDQDGDGDIDEGRRAENSSDIITWELRYRLWGSHDRRDKKNYPQIFAAMAPSVDEGDAATAKLLLDFFTRNPAQVQSPCRGTVEEFLGRPENIFLLERIGVSDQQAAQVREDIVKKIDSSLLVTMVFGGTERKDLFGADKRMVGIRASQGVADAGLSANLDYMETEGLNGAQDQEAAKLAAAYSRILLKDLVGHKEQGVTLSISLAWEKYRNVPDTAHDQISKVSFKLMYPISDAVSMPISFTWANHEDLLQDEDEIRGHIGFTFDIRKLFQTTTGGK